MTYLPHFVHDGKSKIIYADVAGLFDTHGPLMEYINMFMIKGIFQKAKNMRFIIPLTLGELSQGKGMSARAHLKKIQDMFQGNMHQMVEHM